MRDPKFSEERFINKIFDHGRLKSKAEKKWEEKRIRYYCSRKNKVKWFFLFANLLYLDWIQRFPRKLKYKKQILSHRTSISSWIIHLKMLKEENFIIV